MPPIAENVVVVLPFFEIQLELLQRTNGATCWWLFDSAVENDVGKDAISFIVVVRNL